jgi:hypothetical protein
MNPSAAQMQGGRERVGIVRCACELMKKIFAQVIIKMAGSRADLPLK